MVFSLATTYAEVYTRVDSSSIKLVNLYDLARREYDYNTEYFKILGVEVRVSLLVRRLIVDANNEFDISYEVRVLNGPQGWLLNITEVAFGEFEKEICFYRKSVQRPLVLVHDSKKESYLTIRTRVDLNRPGNSYICHPELRLTYIAIYGTNREEGYISIKRQIVIKPKELPLELKHEIYAVKVVGRDEIILSAAITVRNTQNWDIVISHYDICTTKENTFLITCQPGELLGTIVLKPGEEHMLIIRGPRLTHKPLWHNYVAYIIHYYYPGGGADSWVVFRVAREAFEDVQKTFDINDVIKELGQKWPAILLSPPTILFLIIAGTVVVAKQLRYRRKTKAVQDTYKTANQSVPEAATDHEGHRCTVEEEPFTELPYVESSSEITSLTDHHGVTPAGTGEEGAMKAKRSPAEVYNDLDVLLSELPEKTMAEMQLIYLSRLMMLYLLGEANYEELKELSEEYIKDLKSSKGLAVRPEVRRLTMEAAKLAEEREELKPIASLIQLYLSEASEEMKASSYMTEQTESKPLSLLRLDEKSSAILSKLSSARSHLKNGKINEAVLDLYEAVSETINLILEAEGLKLRRPDGRELTVRKKFRLLVERGWVGRGATYFFTRLQTLRNRVMRSPESITITVDEVKLLLSFHTLFVRVSLKKLKSLSIKNQRDGNS